MKEQHTFYFPNAAHADMLPEEEAKHAVRALRMSKGDTFRLLDGKGMVYEAVVEETTNKHCRYTVTTVIHQQKWWHGWLHMAIAPTKHIERTELFVEKAIEMGVDEITFLRGRFSERTTIRMDRIEKIIIAAMKQSRNAYMPVLHDMTSVEHFLQQQAPEKRESTQNERLYIAHCYDEVPRIHLQQELIQHPKTERVTMMIGPEGDFSIDEVRTATTTGALSVTLGENRFRTETAAMVALMTMHFCQRQYAYKG